MEKVFSKKTWRETQAFFLKKKKKAMMSLSCAKNSAESPVWSKGHNLILLNVKDWVPLAP